MFGIETTLALFVGYFVGSIPFGLMLTRMAGIDLRAVGSGNIGATNVLRTGRKDLAIATLILDSFKAGLVAVVVGRFLLPEAGVWVSDAGIVAGAAAFVGHCYPVWLKFNGGKGVATYAGLVAFASWKGFIIAGPLWLGVAILSRISALGALIAAALTPFGAWVLGERPFVVGILAVLSILAFWTHRANIRRILDGTEPRFGKGQ